MLDVYICSAVVLFLKIATKVVASETELVVVAYFT